MSKVFYLFKVSIEKSIKELLRYKFNTISEIMSLYALFIAMFFGMKLFGTSMNVSPVRLGETLEGFVAGYFLWTVMLVAYSETASSVISDANRGTLEQISMSGLGLHNILIVRSITNLIVNLLVCFIVLFTIMATTGYWINLKILQLLVLILLGIFSILGIALMFGGLALIFKKVQSLLNIVQYFLIGLVMPGSNAFSPLISAILPFRPTIEKVYDITLGGESLMDFSLGDFGIIIGNSIVYFFIGLFVFNQCSKIAKKKGLLGQY
ncbi:ABC transporter permease [Clostridium hydrogeniformans]|uniref:ABC transporter permease n=1 Tax=Clostridium hydrogeniformans TaxID=349933 RepID=UPI000481907B|nr:ABC transporter permease [Clostridium hydrogeniformans]